MSPARMLRWKLVLSAAFLAGASSFALPFVAVSADQRVARGTGIELATGDATYSGRYVHASYRGEVEDVVETGQLSAAVMLASALAGCALTWLSRRKGLWLGFGAGLLSAFSIFWFRQATTTAFSPPETDYRSGFWASAAVLLLAAVLGAVALRRTSWSFLHR